MMARLVVNDLAITALGLAVAFGLTAVIGLPIAGYGVCGLVCLWIEAKH